MTAPLRFPPPNKAHAGITEEHKPKTPSREQVPLQHPLKPLGVLHLTQTNPQRQPPRDLSHEFLVAARLGAQENNGLKRILNEFGFPTSKMKVRAAADSQRGKASGEERRHRHRVLRDNPATLRFHLKPKSPPPIRSEPLLPGAGTARPGHAPTPLSRCTLPPRTLQRESSAGRPGDAGGGRGQTRPRRRAGHPTFLLIPAEFTS